MLEIVGSNPTILTGYCPVAQRWCDPLLTGRVQVRVLPGQLGTEGQAKRLMAPAWNAGEAQALAGSTPVPSAGFDEVVLLGEQPVSKAGAVGSNPTDLAVVLAGQPGVAATLSRWRSGVQISSGTLGQDRVPSGQGPV